MAQLKCRLSLVVLSVALAHCSKAERSEPQPGVAPPSDTAKMTPASGTEGPDARRPLAEPMAPAAETLSDEQIIKLVDLANGAEVDEGKFAETKATHARVKKFAVMMVKHHGEAKQKGNKLATKLSLSPAESSLSTKMKSDSEKSMTQLKDTKSEDFDRAYIDAQIDEHKKVLSTIDDKLIPAAKDAELKSLLQEMRATVQSHLTEAQQIRSEIQG